MAQWAKCTIANSQVVHLNLDHVIQVTRERGHTVTGILLTDGRTIDVVETPEEFFKRPI